MWQLLFVVLDHFTFCLAFLSQGLGRKGHLGSTLKGCKATSKSFGNCKCGKLLFVKILILVNYFFVNRY